MTRLGSVLLPVVVLLTTLQLAAGSDECSIPGCEGEGCKVSCEHGSCADDGSCECHQCWTGPQCTSFANSQPVFDKSLRKQVINLSMSTQPGEKVTSLDAKDPDAPCQEVDGDAEACSCAEITYTILKGNDEGLFWLNDKTGELFTHERWVGVPGSNFRIIVGAYNEPPEDSGEKFKLHDLDMDAYSMVKIHVEDIYKSNDYGPANGIYNVGGDDVMQESSNGYGGYEEPLRDDGYSYDEPLHRARRAIPAGSPSVNNITIYMGKAGVFENVTEMQVGGMIHFELAIQLPDLHTTEMLVELFTPDNDTTHMVICNAEITAFGSALSSDRVVPYTPLYEAKVEGSTEYDRAIFDFGNLTQTSAGASADDSRFVVEWDVIRINNALTINYTQYWVSAGAEYNDAMEVWVGQASLTAFDLDNLQETDPVTGASGIPTFNFYGPSELEIGSSACYRVDMYIPYPSVKLAFDAFTPLNATDAMSVCSVLLVDTGEYYECLHKENYDFTTYPATEGKGNSRARLDLEEVVNKGSRLPASVYDWNQNMLGVEFCIWVYDNDTLIGDGYWIGAAIEIGTYQIWAGQMFVEIIAATPAPAMVENPTMSMSTEVADNDFNVVEGQPVVYYVDVLMPENTTSDYSLEVLTAFNGTARMQLCRVSVVFQGVNVPCFSDAEPVYTSRASDLVIMDRAEWNLGKIKNTGGRDGTLDPEANKVTFMIVATMLSHALNVDGEKVWVTVGLSFGGNRIWAGQNAVQFASTNSFNTNDTAPNFDITLLYGDDSIPIGGMATVVYEISTIPGVAHTPMEVEIIMPYNDSAAVMSICRAEIIYAGDNVPCFQRVLMNDTLAAGLISKSNDTTYSKAVVALGSVCNVAPVGTPASDEDKIKIAVTVKMEEHALNVNGAKHWSSAGVMYTTTKMWVGQLALIALVGVAGEGDLSVSQLDEFYAAYDRVDDPYSMDLGLGQSATFMITAKLPPGSTGDYTFRLLGTNDCTVCNLRLVKRGWNIPCHVEVDANYTKHADTIRDVEGIYYAGIITNPGLDPVYNDTIFDNNTMVFEVTLKMEDTAVGVQAVTFDVDIGTSLAAFSVDMSLTPVAPAVRNSTNNTTPTFNFQRAPIRENDTVGSEIQLGGVAKFWFDIIPDPGTENHIDVKFLAPVNLTGAMEVCDVNVIYVGGNQPCLKRKLLTSTKSSRVPGSGFDDVGSIDLGYVCSVDLNNLTEVPDAGMVRVEAIAKVNKNLDPLLAPVAVGDSLWFSATCNINSDMIYVSQLHLLVVDDSLIVETNHDVSEADVMINETAPAIQMSPAGIYDVSYILTIPANATVGVMVDVETPMNDSAVMTVHHIEMVEGSAGRNLGCLSKYPKDEFEASYNSTVLTTQMDKGYYHLGWVTNTGVTYRIEDILPEDNQVAVKVQVQMADSIVNTHTSQHVLSFGAQIGGSVIIIDKMVELVRTNNEEPILNLTADIVTTTYSKPLYLTGEFLAANCTLQHSELSTAEGYNVTATFHIPRFMKYSSMLDINFTMPQVVNTTYGTGISFIFDRIFFTDIVWFTFLLEVDTQRGMPNGASDVNASAPFELGYDMIDRPANVRPAGTWFVKRIDPLSFRVSGPASVACALVPLGLEDGDIQDCQITASESLYTGFEAIKVRKGNANGFKAHVRRGNFKKYIMVFFGNVTKVAQIELETKGGDKVQQYELEYSDDGLVWTAGDTITPTYTGNTALDSVPNPVDARYIRVMFTATVLMTAGQDDGEINVVMEFIGCVTVADVDPAAVYSRGFVGAAAGVHYCDINPYKNGILECYMSTDGVSWQAHDNSVVNILGVDLEDLLVYGISWDRRAFMVSEDQGGTWTVVNHDKYALSAAKDAARWVPAKEVKWMKSADITPGLTNPALAYQKDIWGACYDGIYRRNGAPWVKVADWTICCA